MVSNVMSIRPALRTRATLIPQLPRKKHVMKMKMSASKALITVSNPLSEMSKLQCIENPQFWLQDGVSEVLLGIDVVPLRITSERIGLIPFRSATNALSTQSPEDVKKAKSWPYAFAAKICATTKPCLMVEWSWSSLWFFFFLIWFVFKIIVFFVLPYLIA